MPSNDNLFQDEDFKANLKAYEEAQRSGMTIFLDSDDYADIAEYYNTKGDTQEALKAVHKGLETYPGANYLISFLLRYELHIKNNPTTASEYLDQMADKEQEEYIFCKADILLYNQQVDAAMTVLQTYYEDIQDSEQDDFAFDAAFLLLDYSCFHEARVWLDVIADEDSCDFQELKGRVALGLDNAAEAINIFQQLLDEHPFNGEYWNLLANAQIKIGDLDSALTSCEYAIAINPKDYDAQYIKAGILYSLSNYEGCLTAYNRLLELNNSDIQLYFMKGAALMNLGRYSDAEATFEEAKSILTKEDPTYTNVLCELILALSRKKEKEKALAYVDELSTFPQQEAEALVLKGHVCLENGAKEEAMNVFAAALEKSNYDVHLQLRIAISAYDCGYIDAAYNLLVTLLSKHKYEEAYSYMALCAKALGKNEEYLKFLKLTCEYDAEEARAVLGEYFPADVQPKDYYTYAKRQLIGG